MYAYAPRLSICANTVWVNLRDKDPDNRTLTNSMGGYKGADENKGQR